MRKTMSQSPPEGVTAAPRSMVPIPPRYAVTRQIGVGGMASIWAAEDEVLRRYVAIKVLAEHLAEQPAFVARFEREARTAAALTGHPHVVTVYDVGEHAGRPFIVMEYLPGGTVADRIADGARPSRGDVLRWLSQAASALDFAHARGVVHRDVKPQNLLFDEQGALVVADLGIARAAFETSLTSSGELLGTAAYMAPEQVDGAAGTPASDRYALGVVAYRLLSGSQPFPGGTLAEQAQRKLATDPLPPSQLATDLPKPVDAVLMQALDRDPARRWESASAFVEALEEALGAAPASADHPEPAQPPEPVTQQVAAPSTRSWGALLPSALALLVGAVAIWAIGGVGGSGGGDSPTPKEKRHSASSRQAAPTGAPAPRAPAAASPASLNDQGFALMGQGRYADAVPVLRRAVAGFPAGSTDLTYAYALYNLGRSLRLAGQPAAAIPVLERRLKFANQRGTVARELAAARRQAG